jgi:predicted enzyme related to lactoylglutathione lyase
VGRTDRVLAGELGGSEPGIDGGIGGAGGRDQTTNTIDVPDLDAAVAAVEAAGGTITRPKGPVPGVGWLAYATDTEGTPFGMMQADESAA